MNLEQTECSETLTYKIQTPGNYPEESTQHSAPWSTTSTWERIRGFIELLPFFCGEKSH